LIASEDSFRKVVFHQKKGLQSQKYQTFSD
jgi:hypothetical protein